MRPVLLRFWVLVLSLAMGCGVALAAGHVIDDTHMFSTTTVDQLNSQIDQMSNTYHKNVTVVTVPSTNGTWQSAAQRYVGPNVDGVLIFIDKGAHKTYVAVGNRTQEALDVGRQQTLKDTINAQFKQQNFDGGILAGLSYIQSIFGAAEVAPAQQPMAPQRQPIAVAQRPSSGGFGIVGLIVVLLVILVVVKVLQALFRGGQTMNTYNSGGSYPMGAGGGPYPQQGGGGGFWSSFLGGAGGAIAGNALFDHFERRPDNQGYVEPSGGGSGAPSQPDFQAPDTSTNWGDSGSSWGGDSGSSSSADSGSSWDSGSSGGGGSSDWS